MSVKPRVGEASSTLLSQSFLFSVCLSVLTCKDPHASFISFLTHIALHSLVQGLKTRKDSSIHTKKYFGYFTPCMVVLVAAITCQWQLKYHTGVNVNTTEVLNPRVSINAHVHESLKAHVLLKRYSNYELYGRFLGKDGH